MFHGPFPLNFHYQDCHGDHLGRTKSDKSQDLKLIDYYESKEFTAMEFERKLDTCDKNDFEIKVYSIVIDKQVNQ